MELHSESHIAPSAALWPRQGCHCPASTLVPLLAGEHLLMGAYSRVASSRTMRPDRPWRAQNIIMSTVDNKAKLIDLGAAADLRVGINYVPSEFLLDPRYAPPQQYIMSTSTPRAPPLPVAALLSPILWRLNTPDRCGAGLGPGACLRPCRCMEAGSSCDAGPWQGFLPLLQRWLMARGHPVLLCWSTASCRHAGAARPRVAA